MSSLFSIDFWVLSFNPIQSLFLFQIAKVACVDLCFNGIRLQSCFYLESVPSVAPPFTICESCVFTQLIPFVVLFTLTPPFMVSESYKRLALSFPLSLSCTIIRVRLCYRDSFIHDSTSFTVSLWFVFNHFIWLNFCEKNISCVLIISSIHDLWFVLNYFIRLNFLQKIFLCSSVFYSQLLSHHVQYVVWLIFYSCYLNLIYPQPWVLSRVFLLYDLFWFVIILVPRLLHSQYVSRVYCTTSCVYFRDSFIYDSWLTLVVPLIHDMLMNLCLIY